MNVSLEHALVELLRQRLPAIFLAMDSKLRVQEANQHTRALLGEEILGAELQSLLAQAQSLLTVEELLSWVGESRQLHFKTFNGMVESVECRFLRHQQGFMMVGGVDHRQHEILTAELLASNRELSNRRRELQKALQELSYLDQLKDRFLGMAAHDLRHPIQTVRIIADLALQETDRSLEEYLQDFEEIREANLLMGQVVDSFLSLAVLRSGNLNVVLRPVCLVALVEETLQLIRPTASQKGIPIRLETGFQPEVMPLDGSKIKQVLLNLLTNALEHGPPGQEVVVRIRRSNEAVLLDVIDQGGGVPLELQANLFEAFVHGQASERGTGLGLHIAKLIAEAHQGKLSVCCNGQGSVFTLALPVVRESL